MAALRASYWALVALFVGFGLLAILSIGLPFLATGIALAALAPFRDRPRVFWPWLVAVVVFFAGYALAAPLTCSARGTVATPSGNGPAAAAQGGGDVVCTNLLGIGYRGGPGYDPPRWPAAVAGAAAALGSGLGTRAVLAKRPA